MRGTAPNIAIWLALVALIVTGVASDAQAKVGGNAAAAAAQKVSKGAQVRLNRMKAKMALRPRGTMAQKTRRQIRLGKKQLMRAMGRREVGLHGSESERARAAFARGGIGERRTGTASNTMLQAPQANQAGDDSREKLEKLARKQRRKMRVAAKKRAARAFNKLRSKRGD